MLCSFCALSFANRMSLARPCSGVLPTAGLCPGVTLGPLSRPAARPSAEGRNPVSRPKVAVWPPSSPLPWAGVHARVQCVFGALCKARVPATDVRNHVLVPSHFGSSLRPACFSWESRVTPRSVAVNSAPRLTWLSCPTSRHNTISSQKQRGSSDLRSAAPEHVSDRVQMPCPWPVCSHLRPRLPWNATLLLEPPTGDSL